MRRETLTATLPRAVVLERVPRALSSPPLPGHLRTDKRLTSFRSHGNEYSSKIKPAMVVEQNLLCLSTHDTAVESQPLD